jgi:Spy/CpxP family protein refolding chaperone
MTVNWTKWSKTAGVVAAIAAVLAVSFGAWLSADAANSDGAGNLIDKDFQSAIRKHFERRFFNLIDASDNQRQAIDKMLGAQADQLLPTREQLRDGLVELNNMCAKEDTTDSQITDKVHELRALHEQIMDTRLATMLKVRQQLTQDQRKTICDKLNNVLTGAGKGTLLHRMQSTLPEKRLSEIL